MVCPIVLWAAAAAVVVVEEEEEEKDYISVVFYGWDLN